MTSSAGEGREEENKNDDYIQQRTAFFVVGRSGSLSLLHSNLFTAPRFPYIWPWGSPTHPCRETNDSGLRLKTETPKAVLSTNVHHIHFTAIHLLAPLGVSHACRETKTMARGLRPRPRYRIFFPTPTLLPFVATGSGSTTSLRCSDTAKPSRLGWPMPSGE